MSFWIGQLYAHPLTCQRQAPYRSSLKYYVAPSGLSLDYRNHERARYARATGAIAGLVCEDAQGIPCLLARIFKQVLNTLGISAWMLKYEGNEEARATEQGT